MKWLSCLLKRMRHDDLRPEVNNKEDIKEAQTLLKGAREALKEAEQRRVETRKVTSSLAVLNGFNHYGESIFLAMMPKERQR